MISLIKRALGIRSPSLEYSRVGEAWLSGSQEGVERKEPLTAEEMAELMVYCKQIRDAYFGPWGES